LDELLAIVQNYVIDELTPQEWQRFLKKDSCRLEIVQPNTFQE
jgi:hypothetical protein